MSKTEKEYLKDSLHCPYCNSHRIEGDDIKEATMPNSQGTVYQDIKCIDCKGIWRDIFTLTGVEFISPESEAQ